MGLLGNHVNGRQFCADLFFQDKYMNALQTNCPHLLRYLAVAVVTSPRLRNRVKDAVRLINAERHAHSDPITQFLEDLYLKCNFENAQRRLQECELVLKYDYFLSNSEGDFRRSARQYIFE